MGPSQKAKVAMIERGAIYLVQSGKLVGLDEQTYADESELQTFLASYPKLLAGEQLTPDAPRRWLLIRREMAIPDEEEGTGRWSVDLLFVDQEAIPTLVEVKRASDPRVRREVVGQMLDYAANAVAFWPSERLETSFEQTCIDDEADAAERLDAFLEGVTSRESFWERARTNLQAGRIRMVFVADEIPTELRQIVRFLQWQLDPAEVYAVEVPQYAGEGLTALVPRWSPNQQPRRRRAGAIDPSDGLVRGSLNGSHLGMSRNRLLHKHCSIGVNNDGSTCDSEGEKRPPSDRSSITTVSPITRSPSMPTAGS